MSVKELNGMTEFKKFLENEYTLIDFWAPWCGPCRMLAPLLDEVSKDYAGKIHFGKIDIEANGEVGGTYGIQSIPCLIMFKHGKEKTRIIGLQQKTELKKKIDGAL